MFFFIWEMSYAKFPGKKKKERFRLFVLRFLSVQYSEMGSEERNKKKQKNKFLILPQEKFRFYFFRSVYTFRFDQSCVFRRDESCPKERVGGRIW